MAPRNSTARSCHCRKGCCERSAVTIFEHLLSFWSDLSPKCCFLFWFSNQKYKQNCAREPAQQGRHDQVCGGEVASIEGRSVFRTFFFIFSMQICDFHHFDSHFFVLCTTISRWRARGVSWGLGWISRRACAAGFKLLSNASRYVTTNCFLRTLIHHEQVRNELIIRRLFTPRKLFSCNYMFCPNHKGYTERPKSEGVTTRNKLSAARFHRWKSFTWWSKHRARGDRWSYRSDDGNSLHRGGTCRARSFSVCKASWTAIWRSFFTWGETKCAQSGWAAQQFRFVPASEQAQTTLINLLKF